MNQPKRNLKIWIPIAAVLCIWLGDWMVSTITTLISNVVTFAGGLLLLFGAVTLGTNLKDHNGPGISSGAWAMAGGVLIIAVATYFGTLTVG